MPLAQKNRGTLIAKKALCPSSCHPHMTKAPFTLPIPYLHQLSLCSETDLKCFIGLDSHAWQRWRPDGTDAETLPCFTMPGAFRVASHPEVCNRGRDARTWPCNL